MYEQSWTSDEQYGHQWFEFGPTKWIECVWTKTERGELNAVFDLTNDNEVIIV